MKINLQDTKIGAFDYEFLRGISVMRTGGAELGECLETISKIRDKVVAAVDALRTCLLQFRTRLSKLQEEAESEFF